MNRPTLHIIGLPHTIVNDDYSPCAFTGKIRRFSDMVCPLGWKTIEYSNEGSQSNASVHVTILTKKELKCLSKRTSTDENYYTDLDNPTLIALFKKRLLDILPKLVTPKDIICHVFGPNSDVAAATPTCYQLESGIGYIQFDHPMPYRIYESSAWMHWHLGRRHKTNGANYEFVIPNYYNLNDWEVVLTPQSYILFFGRITSSKGTEVLKEIASRLPDISFILCGQTDSSGIISGDNIKILPPIYGKERSTMLGNAAALIAPTMFIEPFCGSAVEAQLCGTPVISSNYGAFHETIENGKTGYRCNTLADFIQSIKSINQLDRKYIAQRARSLYCLETVGKQYDIVLNNIADLANNGWYSPVSRQFNNIKAF